MARYVVKLGSSIVAEDSGALRPAVLARVCDQVAARHAAGDDVVVVTSGAIARGIQLMGLSPRPTAIEDLQAASAVGQGKLYRVYDELLRERGVSPMTWMPRAIAPDVTTTTSSPAAWRAAT